MNDFVSILQQIARSENLTAPQAKDALEQIIAGQVNASRIAAFLFGMNCKGETVEELTALVQVMREASVEVQADLENAVDLCGTGGDHSGTFNVSTAAMFVTAGAGVPVLKHGNAGVSSLSGSYDVLLQLGARPHLQKEQVEHCFRETGIGFMFAPLYHPAMSHVMPVRKELGVRTFFNIMGPMLNPARVKRQLVGAFDETVALKMAQVLANTGTEFAYVLHAEDGMDEISTTSNTRLYEIFEGQVLDVKVLDPRSLGIDLTHSDSLKGGGPDENARIIRAILENRCDDSRKDIVLINAAFAIHVSGIITDLQEALLKARESLESGHALESLHRFIACTRDLDASSA